DTGMTRKPRRWLHGDEAQLGDVIEHPELFKAMPEAAKIPVRFEHVPQGKRPIARTADDCSFEISSDFKDKWLRQNIAKLLHYRIAEGSNFAAPVRHDVEANVANIDSTIAALRAGMKSGQLP